MNVRGSAMLAELPERDATGDLARIYPEIRELCAVPYVSSMQRHLATRPGWLPWAWAAVRRAFVDGSAQEAAWRVAGPIDAPPMPPRDEHAEVLAALARYRETSPQMVVLGALIRDALPAAARRASPAGRY